MLSLTGTKLVAKFAASIGVSKVVGDIIKNNTTVLTTAQKVSVHIGGLVIGSMMVEQAQNHVDSVIDEMVRWNAERKNPTDEKPEVLWQPDDQPVPRP